MKYGKDKLYELLMDLPDKNFKVSSKLLNTVVYEKYTVEVLILDLNGYEDVPAYFIRPNNELGKLPVVIYNHAHGFDYVLGKEEVLTGRPSIKSPFYAEELTDMGYSVICIDYTCFGDRRGKTETATFKEMLLNGKCLWGAMVYDALKTIDYLETREDVDMSRLATMGRSMGATMSFWLAALDSRIKVCIDICCATELEEAIITGGIDLHGIYYFVPSLLKYFKTSDIFALIAPRAHLSINGVFDPLTPETGLDLIDKNTKKAYKKSNNWKLSKYKTGHIETKEMRYEVKKFLQHHL